MRNVILRIIVSAIAIAITAALLPGIQVVDKALLSYLLLGLIFGLVNALIKPIVSLMSCPLVILTLGLFAFVINGIVLMITASLSGGRLIVADLGTAIIGGIVMGIVNMVLEVVLGMNKKG